VTDPPRARTLASLVRAESPLPARRAAAVLLPVVRQLRRDEAAGRHIADLRSQEVLLSTDGSVQIRRVVSRSPGPDMASEPEIASGPEMGRAPEMERAPEMTIGQEVAAGACVGRLMVELLVGRPALGRDDALEPHITSSLPMRTTTLLARSCDDVSGQWPDLEQWATELATLAGAAAAPLAPAELASRRRRRIGLVVGTAILVALSVAAVILAPRWWDAATSEEGSPAVATATAPGHGVSAGTDRSSAAPRRGAAQ